MFRIFQTGNAVTEEGNKQISVVLFDSVWDIFKIRFWV